MVELHYVSGTGTHRYSVCIDGVAYADVLYAREDWEVFPHSCTPIWLTIDDLQIIAEIAGKMHGLLTFTG